MTYDQTKYRPGLGKDWPLPRKSHLYTVDHAGNFIAPMCKYGANLKDHTSFQIYPERIGGLGICNICVKRAAAGKDGIWKVKK